MVDHRCPKCDGDMITQERDAIAVAACEGCGGLWIDTTMLDMLARRSDSKSAVAELSTWAESDPVSIREHHCPSCKDSPLEVHNHGDLEIDWCRNCKGIYLDKGERKRAVKSRHDRKVGAADHRPGPGGVGEHPGAWLVEALDWIAFWR